MFDDEVCRLSCELRTRVYVATTETAEPRLDSTDVTVRGQHNLRIADGKYHVEGAVVGDGCLSWRVMRARTTPFPIKH